MDVRDPPFHFSLSLNSYAIPTCRDNTQRQIMSVHVYKDKDMVKHKSKCVHASVYMYSLEHTHAYMYIHAMTLFTLLRFN